MKTFKEVPANTTFQIEIVQKGHLQVAGHFLSRKIILSSLDAGFRAFEVLNCANEKDIASCIGVDDPLIWPKKWLDAAAGDTGEEQAILERHTQTTGDKPMIISVNASTGNPNIPWKSSSLIINEDYFARFERVAAAGEKPGDYCEVKILVP